ncbi:MAG: lipopolysaccharide biosynthesis protein [Phycisphaeraceae bacterium]
MSSNVTIPSVDHPADRHFRTDHLTADLKGRSVRGGAVTMAAQGCKFGLQMGSTMVLARLLTPADFGLIAMVSAFTGFVSLFKDLGLSMATVQRPEVNHAQVSTLFWINVGLSLVLMAITAALAPAVALFYGEPALTWVTLAIAGTFIFGGLSAQHTALLRRQMRFTALASIQVTAMAVSVGVAIAMAWWGASYWALVGLNASQAVTIAVLSWVCSGWRPGLPRRDAEVGSMLAFGGNSVAASTLNYAGTNLDNVLIGWWVGSAALGFYTKAYSLLTLPLRQISAPLGGVAIPAMSRAIADPQRYRRAYLSAATQLLCLTIPLALYFIVFAGDVIYLLLGPQWQQAGHLFAILGFAAIILPFWNSAGWVWISQGRMREHLHFQAISFVVKTGFIVIGLPWGVTGVAYGVAVRYYLALPLLFYMLGRRGPISQGDLYKMLGWPVVVAAVVGAALHGAGQFTAGQSMALRLLCGAAVGLGVWLALHAMAKPGRRVLMQYYSLFPARLRKFERG